MAFDARYEDYQRMALRYSSTLDQSDPAAAARSFAGFGRRFAQDRDSLPQTDSDRAFHLMSLAAYDIDYLLPFASEAKAKELMDRAGEHLDKAVELDNGCYDALRMRAARSIGNFESFYQFLDMGVEEVRRGCEEQRDAVSKELGPDRISMARALAMAPYLRWMAMLANEALICGRNRHAIEIGSALLQTDPSDTADVRFTMALAFAKLEDEAGFEQFEAKIKKSHPLAHLDDAWTQIARITFSYKKNDKDKARDQLAHLIETYGGYAEAFIRQSELPDGVFSRFLAPSYSADELIVATSEATVLFAEGFDYAHGGGSFSEWLKRTASELYPDVAASMMDETPYPDHVQPEGGDE
jgi:tetratricopeptide (TPR) repeat protein